MGRTNQKNPTTLPNPMDLSEWMDLYMWDPAKLTYDQFNSLYAYNRWDDGQYFHWRLPVLLIIR